MNIAFNRAQGNCKVSSINPVQSLFAANTAMVAGPIVGPAGSQLSSIFKISNIAGTTMSSGLFGAGVSYTNTSFNNAYNGENNNALASSFIGGSAGALGSAFGIGVLKWTGSTLNSNSINNIISNFPSFLPTPAVSSETNNKTGVK